MQWRLSGATPLAIKSQLNPTHTGAPPRGDEMASKTFSVKRDGKPGVHATGFPADNHRA